MSVELNTYNKLDGVKPSKEKVIELSLLKCYYDENFCFCFRVFLT